MATEKRLIDANALCHFMCRKCNDAYSNEPCEPCDCIFLNAIDESPTVDAVEVVHGRWLNWQGDPISPDDYWRIWRCSECKHEMEFDEAVDREDFPSNYCPNCGAKMDGERK